MGASGERTIISPRRSPPDYTKRSVKLRIFAYLAVLILILSVWERSSLPPQSSPLSLIHRDETVREVR